MMDMVIDKTLVEKACGLLHVSVQTTPEGIIRSKQRLTGISLKRSSSLYLNVIGKSTISQQDFDAILDAAFVQLTLSQYRNQLIHLFSRESLLAAVLLGNQTAETGDLS